MSQGRSPRRRKVSGSQTNQSVHNSDLPRHCYSVADCPCLWLPCRCGDRRVPGRPGVARAAPAGGRRAPAVLRPAHGGASGDRVRVHQPAGVRDVDQGRGAAPEPRRRAEAPRVTTPTYPPCATRAVAVVTNLPTPPPAVAWAPPGASIVTAPFVVC
jgi:hypothetical protein